MKYKILTALLLMQLCVAPCFANESLPHSERINKAKVERKKLVVDERQRRYKLYLPKNRKSAQPAPLIVVLHGALTNAGIVEWTSGMSKQADKDGFIVAYPEGTGPLPGCLLTWNAGSCCGSARDGQIDDVKFIKLLINELKSDYNADPNRIYVAGMSNGGMMAYRIGCELADTVAAIASVEGCLLTKSCEVSSPVSVIAFHGTKDSVIPYEGGIGLFLGCYKVRTTPVEKTIKHWVTRNGCEPTPSKEEDDVILKETYPHGANNTEVCLYTVKGGRHTWPGGKLQAVKHRRAFSATAEMCKFFLEHPKQQQPNQTASKN